MTTQRTASTPRLSRKAGWDHQNATLVVVFDNGRHYTKSGRIGNHRAPRAASEAFYAEIRAELKAFIRAGATPVSGFWATGSEAQRYLGTEIVEIFVDAPRG